MVYTKQPHNALIDLDRYVGQRSASFKFFLYDATTGINIRELHPYRDSAPTLSHDTERTITRQISNLFFDVADTAALNVLSNRLRLQMLIDGIAEPFELGIYMFVDQTNLPTTAGLLSTATMTDEMFIVDQEMSSGYSAGVFDDNGNLMTFTPADQAMRFLLKDLPVRLSIEATPFYSIGSWTMGTNRGSAIEDLAVDGDYFSPWFGNDGQMHCIRVFDPFNQIPDFDYDNGFQVDRNTVALTDDLLQAPNRFIVISNGSASDQFGPVVGVYDVPSSAPHSIANRGFVIPSVTDWQVDLAAQAQAIAANLGQRQTLFQRVEFETPPDPRHDSYNVFKLFGDLWLEISWELELVEGGTMSHVGRKVYR